MVCELVLGLFVQNGCNIMLLECQCNGALDLIVYVLV
jgi:hypothetical protein